MKKQALWPAARTAMVTGFYALCAVGALGFADHSLGKVGATALRRIYGLANLPERRLGESWTSPALVRATLHTRSSRQTPSGTASAIWYGWIEEVPGVNCQEATREALIDTLKITLAEAIEFNRDEARNAAGKGYEELPIAV